MSRDKKILFRVNSPYKDTHHRERSTYFYSTLWAILVPLILGKVGTKSCFGLYISEAKRQRAYEPYRKDSFSLMTRTPFGVISNWTAGAAALS
jgi:hypothetical protein